MLVFLQVMQQGYADESCKVGVILVMYLLPWDEIQLANPGI